jgi:hypothetical protein
MNTLDPYTCFIVLFLLFVIGSVIWSYRRSADMLRNWAAQNHYRLVAYTRSGGLFTPFFWTTSKSQVIFRVTVEDDYGTRRSGWVRCGNWLSGMLSDQIDVRWDE